MDGGNPSNHLGKESLPSLFGDVPNLIFYLGDVFEVSASFVVRYLSGELVDLLLVLPARFRRNERD